MLKGSSVLLLLMFPALSATSAEGKEERSLTLQAVVKSHYHLVGQRYILPDLPETTVKLRPAKDSRAELDLADAFNQAKVSIRPLEAGDTVRSEPKFGVLEGRPLAIDRGVILVVERLQRKTGNAYRLDGEILTHLDNQFEWYNPVLTLTEGFGEGARPLVNQESVLLGKPAPIYPQERIRRFKVWAEFYGGGGAERLTRLCFTFQFQHRVSGEEIHADMLWFDYLEVSKPRK